MFVNKLEESFANICYYVFAVRWAKPYYVSVSFAFLLAGTTLIVGVAKFT
jgi:hypothetical protein